MFLIYICLYIYFLLIYISINVKTRILCAHFCENKKKQGLGRVTVCLHLPDINCTKYRFSIVVWCILGELNQHVRDFPSKK